MSDGGYLFVIMKGFMRRFLLLVLCCLFAFSFVGCEKKISSGGEEAYAAYLSFITNLRACGNDPEYQDSSDKQECDRDAIWNALDDSTKYQVTEAYTTLIRIDRIIKEYFDSIEHKQMRAQAGTDFIDDCDRLVTDDDIKNFFFRTFDPSKVVFNENVDSGLQLQSDYIENENTVHINTYQKGGNSQVFTMKKGSDGVWRTTFFNESLTRAYAPIFSSATAMREYAKGNLEIELKRRAEVRDYFLLQAAVQRKQKQEAVEAMKAALESAEGDE